MLLRNGRSIFQNPGTFAGAVRGEKGSFVKGGLRNRFVGGFSGIFGAYPSGHLAPNAFILPQKAGAISSRTLSRAEIAGDADLIPGRNLTASGTLSIVVTQAQLDQIVSGSGSSSMSISATSALLAAAAGASASGTLSITKSDAILGAIFSVTASGSMSITASSKTLTALGFMEASAGGPTALSPEGLANAVLGAEIETGYSLQEILRLVSAALAGKVSGASGTTITIRDINDTINRIVASVDGSGNRTSITYDVGD